MICAGRSIGASALRREGLWKLYEGDYSARQGKFNHHDIVDYVPLIVGELVKFAKALHRWCPLRDSLEGGTGGRRCAASGPATHSYALEFVSLEELQAHALSPH